MIDDAFETLDVNAMNSDSEDEDIPYRADPILEPKVNSLYIICQKLFINFSVLFYMRDGIKIPK